jgi:glycogen(starch) synthase
MRVLLISYAFPPSIGGIETSSLLLAQELQRRGHEVVVGTATQSTTTHGFAFPVYYQPSPRRLLALHHWADVVLHNSVSLRFAWPLLIVHRPWVIIHAGRLDNGMFFKFAFKCAHNIAISRHVASHIDCGAHVVPNAYRAETFSNTNSGFRGIDVAFVGRLVHDKGAHVLIRSLALLANEGLTPNTIFIGDGPQEAALRSMVDSEGLEQSVKFVGSQSAEAVAALLNDTRILVVPSTWPEPFGIVALEGIACGCMVIGSNAGGLPDAIGSCGMTFGLDDAEALSAALRKALTDQAAVESCRANATAHLRRHSPQIVVDKYMQIIAKALGARPVHGKRPD